MFRAHAQFRAFRASYRSFLQRSRTSSTLPRTAMIENPARYCTEHCYAEANELLVPKRFARHQLAGRQQQDVQWEHPQERDAKPVDDLHFMPSLIRIHRLEPVGGS